MPGEFDFAMIDEAAPALTFCFLCALLLLAAAIVLMPGLALAGLETLLLPLLPLGFSALALGFVKGLADGLLVPRPPPPPWHTLFWTWYFIPWAVIFFPQCGHSAYCCFFWSDAADGGVSPSMMTL